MVMPHVSSDDRLPQNAEEIFTDFRSRRKAIIRALTSDADHFFSKCDPESENLCLYGNSDETWEVALPPEEVPPELPDPTIGINFARDGMKRHEWFSLVAVHSDSWLLSVAFFLASKLNRSERGRLFNLINELPTVYEVVYDYMRSKSAADTMNKSRPVKRDSSGHVRGNSIPMDEMYVEQDNEQGETLCGSCGRNSNGGDEFWIGCDICDRWFHGKCVKITPAKAESIKEYRCPYCNVKKSRQ